MGHSHQIDHTKDTDITPPAHRGKDRWKDKKAKKERNHEEDAHQAPAPILVAKEAALQSRTRRYFFVLDRRFNTGKLSALMWIPKTDDGEFRFLFPRHDCPEALETLPLSESVKFVSRLNNISMGAQLVVDESSDAAGRVKTYFVENYSGSPSVHPIETERKEYILKSVVLEPELILRLNPRGVRVLTKGVEFMYKLPAYKAEIKPLATALGIVRPKKAPARSGGSEIKTP